MSESNWVRVIDQELVNLHLGVASENDSYDEAKRKLNDLVCWNVQIALDFYKHESQTELENTEVTAMFNKHLPDYLLTYLKFHGYTLQSVNLINEDNEQVILNSEGFTFWNIPDEDLPYQYDYAQMPAKLLWIPKQDELKERVNRDA